MASVDMNRHPKIRLKDIAAELGLSSATVSLCLNNTQTRYQLNAETVRKVREFADKVGYVPDRTARLLKQGSTRCVGLLTNRHWRAGQKCLPAVFAAEQQLSAAGIECRQLSCSDQLEGIKQLRELNCREIIVFDPVVDDDSYCTVTCTQEKISRYFPGTTVYAVDYSVSGKCCQVNTPSFIRLGVKVWDFHAKLVEVMQKHFPGEIMMQSWRCSMPYLKGTHNLPPELIFAIDSENPFKIGEAGALQFLAARKKHHITNVFWGDDRMACGFINELIKHGVKVPDEVNVISFDNLEFSRYLAIPLTTWGVPILPHTNLVLEALLNKKPLENQISLPVLSAGKSANLNKEILAELAPYCQLASNKDY